MRKRTAFAMPISCLLIRRYKYSINITCSDTPRKAQMALLQESCLQVGRGRGLRGSEYHIVILVLPKHIRRLGLLS